jgi:AAA15 family ATPase/GTPase
MLLRFRVANFRSIKDEQELSMVASSLPASTKSLVHLQKQGLDVLRAAAIYGANASGKSNVLDALKFMSGAVTGSHRSWKPEGPIPREPFLLDAHSREASSSFEADFLLDEVRYRYGFKLDSQRILEEWLYSYPNRRMRLLFHRNSQAGAPFTFGKSLRGNNRTIASLARENSLFLSVAAENNHEVLSPVRIWFSAKLLHNAHADMELVKNLLPERRMPILDLLKLADLGISDIQHKEYPQEQRELFEQLLLAIKVGADRTKLDTTALTMPEFSRWRLVELMHLSPDEPSGKALPFERESQGTRVWLSLAGTLLKVLETGAVLCIDELDRSLHPRLALEIVRIFEDPLRNRKNAQLIFNTHDATLLGNLLGDSGLRRDQVWFVEKDAAGATHLYPLTDFKPRRDENLERGYLQGRYGAIPFITSTPFAEAGDDQANPRE